MYFNIVQMRPRSTSIRGTVRVCHGPARTHDRCFAPSSLLSVVALLMIRLHDNPSVSLLRPLFCVLAAATPCAKSPPREALLAPKEILIVHGPCVAVSFFSRNLCDVVKSVRASARPNHHDHILVAVCSALVYWRRKPLSSADKPAEVSLSDSGDMLPLRAPARLGNGPAKSTEFGRSLPDPSTPPRLGLGVAVGERQTEELRSVCTMHTGHACNI